MEKYAVQIDPEKVEMEKRAGKNLTDDPNSNVPLDPVKGSEPFEKRKDEWQRKKLSKKELE